MSDQWLDEFVARCTRPSGRVKIETFLRVAAGSHSLYRSAGGNYMVSPEQVLIGGGVWRRQRSERL